MMRNLVQRMAMLRVPTCKVANPVAQKVFASHQPAIVTISNKFSTMMTKSTVFSSTASLTLPKLTSKSTPPLVFTHPIRFSSTMKKRRMKMNKHKLKKRRKARRMNTKASRVV